MIEFFEFMNGCSQARTILYLIFIIIITFIIFGGTADIINSIRGKVKTKVKDETIEDKENIDE